jgi:ABC-2 type transport system ATP-binding protein
LSKDKEVILKVEHLNKNYGHFHALKDVSFDVPAGKIIGLVGANGAGKSTIMKSITGIISFDSGDIQIDGKAVSKANREALINVGSLIESPGLYPFMSGWDNLKLYSSLGNTSDSDFNEIVNLVGSESFIHRKVKGYSFGQKQRVGIALAMINKPDLLILDEPLNGLDPVGIRDMRNALIAYKQTGKSILLSSHQLRELEAVADDYVFIDHGEIIPNEEVFAKEGDDLEDAFFNAIEKRERNHK